jgi:signal transduction histidine kinase/HPt (histidine-containing phosphotransfer) domain-containing protein/ActR/RegA family two-component response regulator
MQDMTRREMAPAAPARGIFARLRVGIRLQHMLFLAFTLVAAVPVLTLDLWQAHVSYQNEMASVRERHLLVARNLTTTLSRYVTDVEAVFDVSLANGALNEKAPGLTDLLVSLNYQHVCVIRPDGSVEASLPGLVGVARPVLTPALVQEMYKLAQGATGPRLSGVKLDPSGKPVLYVVKALANGRLGLGVVSTAYLVRLQQAIAFGDKGHAVIVDATGRVIGHPLKAWVAEARDISGVNIVQAMLRGETGVMEFHSPAFGGDMVAGFAAVPEAGWGVMVPQPIAELKRRARDIDVIASIVAVVAFAAAALLSWAIARFIAQPVRLVAGTADRILAGEETAEVPPFRGLVPREIYMLGRAFTKMVHGLHRRNAETQRARELAEESSRAKSQFLANVSHEIRTPLNGLLGMVELLAHTDMSGKQRRYAEIASRSGTALLGLVNDILDLSRIEAGRLELANQPFALSALLRETVDLFSEAASAKGLTLELSLPAALDVTLLGDAHRLRQILVNLIGNAVKFTRAGDIVVLVEKLGEADGSMTLRFTVRDTGIGIAPEKQSTIFDNFVQADGATTREFGGTGLGLSIVRQLCTMMGGEIGVESRPGVGSSFWFTVRFAVSDDAPAKEVPPARQMHSAVEQVRPSLPEAAPAPESEHPVRILLVEDNVLNMELSQAMLQSLGCSVVGATDGEQALAAWRPGRFDLVLMDLQMPRMDGFAATAALRERERGSQTRTPILALTAHAMTGDRARSLAAGFDDHLTKPVTFAVLADAIRRWVLRPDAQVSGHEPASRPAPAPSGDEVLRDEVLGEAALEQLRMVERSGNDGLVRRILGQYLQDGPQAMQRLTHAEAAEDVVELLQVAHTLKSNSLYVGAATVHACCVELEIAAGDGWHAGLRDIVARLVAEHERASAAIRRVLDEEAAPTK